MTTHRPPQLPHASNRLFLNDGGMETTLIFHEGVDLPEFAAFVLLADETGRQRLKAYYEPYLELAASHGLGFVLDTPTWRANPDGGAKLGYDERALGRVNADAVAFAKELRDAYATRIETCIVNGLIGPRTDGYVADHMDAAAAEAYHGAQIGVFAEAGVDMVAAYTLSTVAEAVGIARAAHAVGLPCAIAFTVETDGRLADGTPLGEAIAGVDAEAGAAAPAYFMVNCAHPSHFAHCLASDAAWTERLRGIKANASPKSHAELDEAESLDDGDPADLAERYRALCRKLPTLNVLGGCCGTDHRHVKAIAEACLVPA